MEDTYLLLVSKQWTHGIYTLDGDGKIYVGFPISFTKYKNSTACLSAGSRIFIYGMITSGTMINNEKFLYGSYIFVRVLGKEGFTAGWTIKTFTFTSGC